MRRCLLAAFAAAGFLAAVPAVAQETVRLRVEAVRLDGRPFVIDSPAVAPGRVTALLLWSPESLASRKSLGEWQRFVNASASLDVETLAVSTLADATIVERYLNENAPGLPAAILGTHTLGRIADERLPIVLLFDAAGRLRASHAGLFRLRDLEAALTPLLQ